mgnify:CR=1 FL=1
MSVYLSAYLSVCVKYDDLSIFLSSTYLSAQCGLRFVHAEAKDPAKQRQVRIIGGYEATVSWGGGNYGN